MSSPSVIEVMIACYGRQGLERIAKANHPVISGVSYSVSCQMADENDLPEALRRNDFRVRFYKEKGLSRNRNRGLDTASGEWLLIADDDLTYPAGALAALVTTLRTERNADLITLRSHTAASLAKPYPPTRCDTRRMPRGWYLTSFEICVRREALQRSGVRFDERFGIGAPTLVSGEEDVFWLSCLRRGLRPAFLPITICTHLHPTTGLKEQTNPALYMAKGVVFRMRYGSLWMLRYALSGIVMATKGILPVPLSVFLKAGIKGGREFKV